MVYRIQPRKTYPSDLTDEQWAIVGPLIPPAKQSNRGGRPRTVDMREVLNTVEFIPIKSSAAMESDAPENCAGHNRVPSRDRGRPPSTGGAGL